MADPAPTVRPLFERYPRLRGSLPCRALAHLPTPLRPMLSLGASVGAADLWLKDDGRSSASYGGNKVRKLELVLAAALARGASSVVTFGYAGSNHATATAVHAASLGLQAVSMLLPQLGAAYLRKNLLVSAAVGAELHEYPSRAALVAGTAAAMLRRRLAEGRAPFVVAPGGSSPLGTAAFVNAAFELAGQVEAGIAPRPERIYAAAGSLGTVVGLSIGLAALGWPTRVVGVRVVDEAYVNVAKAASLRRATVALLRSADPAFPRVGDADGRLELRDGFFGGEYACVTPEGAEARRLASELEGLELDRTYTAKALACALADLRAGRAGGPVLFWNTCNGADLSALAARASERDLPRRLRRYFEGAGTDGVREG